MEKQMYHFFLSTVYIGGGWISSGEVAILGEISWIINRNTDIRKCFWLC